MILGWFSCGITSAVACKIALQEFDNVELYYTDTGSQDKDSFRFLADCERWYGKKINVVKSDLYSDHFDLIEQKRLIRAGHFHPCTKILKKELRYRIEDEIGKWDGQIWGFDISEKHRAKRMKEQYPNMKPIFPLIDKMLTKENCAFMLQQIGIKLPLMYRMGYKNNNCVGCVRGGMGYWNKIRVDFPNVFKKMEKLERKIGASCLKDNSKPLFLDELEPDRGDFSTEIMPECGLFCDLEFMNIKQI